MSDDAPFGAPFDDAVRFFRQKTSVGTAHWTDVYAAAHARSFMVAGASSEALVGDLREAVDAAIADGESLEDFRTRFDSIVKRHGWAYNGGRNWRTRVIYETNLTSAYAAGRHYQQTLPDVLELFPYWQYQHSGALNPREQHVAWDGAILRANDPTWRWLYPPNGWGCGCWVLVLSEDDLARMGRFGPDQAPAQNLRPWRNPRTGRVTQVPEGVDPGFEWNPGLQWVNGEMGGATVPPSAPLSAEAARAYIDDALAGGRSAFELQPVMATPGRFRSLGADTDQPVWLSVQTIRDDTTFRKGTTAASWLDAALDTVRTGAVYRDRQGRLVLIAQIGGVLWRAGIKTTGENRVILSAFRRTNRVQVERLEKTGSLLLEGE